MNHDPKTVLAVDAAYEADLIDSFENDEWTPAPDQEVLNANYAAWATQALAKNRRVNIRISAMDLESLQARAAEDGLPYQTLMASILHRYVSGRLTDRITG